MNLITRIIDGLEADRMERLGREIALSLHQWGMIESSWEPRIANFTNGNNGRRIYMAYGDSGHVVEVLITPLADGTFGTHLPQTADKGD